MRSFLDAILVFIGAATLSDEEWASIETFTDQHVTLENYQNLLAVLNGRELVSSVTDRLRFYFLAGSVEIPNVSISSAPELGKSNVYFGDAL